MLGFVLFALSATLATIAIIQRTQGALLAAVAAYCGTAVYLILAEPGLFPAALALALVMGLVGLMRFFAGLPSGPAEAAFFTRRDMITGGAPRPLPDAPTMGTGRSG